MPGILLMQDRLERAQSIQHTPSFTQDIKPHLLFIHSFSGCDTTAAFGKVKVNIIKSLRGSEEISKLSGIINEVWCIQDEVGQAVVKALQIQYSGKTTDTLASVRYVF